MLNCAYAALESQVLIAAVTQGLDPAIGYLHTCRPGQVALLYDVMEPLRPCVDRSILTFLHSHTFIPRDFVLKTGGVCRLHPQLGAGVAQITIGCAMTHEIILRLVRGLRVQI